MTIARTSPASTFPIAKRLRKSTPYSSTVWVLIVATRQWAIRRAPDLWVGPASPVSYTPSTVLVLPTSRTSSIGSPWQRAHAAGNHDAQAAVGPDSEEAARVQAVSDAGVTAVFVHANHLAVGVGRTRLHPL